MAWVVLTSSQCEVFQSSNLGCVSICLHLEFLSAVVFSILVFVSLVKFISKYFTLLDAIVNGIVFTISFANFLYCPCTETQWIFMC